MEDISNTKNTTRTLSTKGQQIILKEKTNQIKNGKSVNRDKSRGKSQDKEAKKEHKKVLTNDIVEERSEEVALPTSGI